MGDADLDDLRVDNDRGRSATGTISVETSDDSRRFEFDLAAREERNWADVPILEDPATVVTETDAQREAYEWSGDSESQLSIRILQNEIEYWELIA